MLEAKLAILFWEGTETSGGGPSWVKDVSSKITSGPSPLHVSHSASCPL